MQDKVSYKKKLRINFSPEETRASKGKRYVFFGIIVLFITFLMVISSLSVGISLTPSNTNVLSNESHAIAVYNGSGKEIPFANVSNTAEYASPSNISYIMTNVTAAEMAQNDVGSILTDTGSPNSSSSASVTYSPLSQIVTDSVGMESQTNISTGGSPNAILYYQGNNTVYVANSTGNIVWAINATTGAIIKSITVGSTGGRLGFMALDPVDKHIFITSNYNNSIYVINATTNKLNATIHGPPDSNPFGFSNAPATSAPNGVAYDPVTGDIYVVMTNDLNVSIINPSTNKFIGTMSTPFFASDYQVPYNIMITPSGVKYIALYGIFNGVSAYASNVICVFTPSGGVIGDNMNGHVPSAIEYNGWGIAYDSSNNLAYVSDTGSNTVYAVNSTGHVNATISLPYMACGSTYVPVGNGGKGFVYITATGSNQVMLINTTSQSLVWNGTIGSPAQIVYANSPLVNKVYLTETSGEVVNFGALQQYETVFNPKCSSGSENTPAFTLHLQSPSMHPNEINASAPALRNIILYLFNATYTFTANATYEQLPTSGSYTRSGATPQIVYITFTLADVSVTESGLPSETTWYFNITSPSSSKSSYSSTTTNIDFLIGDGNYSFEISDVKSGTVIYGVSPASNKSGNFTISSSDFIYNVQFVVANAVTLNESGLTIASGAESYAYSQPDRTCDIFTMPISGNYNAVEFTVGAASHTVNTVSFVLVGTGEIEFAIGSTGVGSTNVLNWDTTNVSSTYGQLFTEHISPVTLKGSTDYYLSINILSGSVSWEEQQSADAIKLGYVLNYCDYTSGDQSSSTCTYLYAVGAAASVSIGSSTSWGINIDGYNLSSTTQSIALNLVPGNYNYTTYTNTYINTTRSGIIDVFFFGGYGSLNVGSKAETVNLTFNSATLQENGLLSNMSWGVKFINGGTVTDSFGTTSLTLPLLDGTYRYTGIAPSANYTPSSGSFTISSNNSVVITFTLNTYSVTFTEGLLPQGMSWTVALGPYSNSSTQPAISFMVANGSYDYTITANDYTATPSTGQIIVSGKSVNVSTIFSLTPPEPIVPAYTVTIGFGTSYQNFKPVATFTFTHPINLISIKPYYYLDVNPSYRLMFEVNQSASVHYFAFNLSGNTGAFSGIGYNGFSDLGYIIGGTGIIIALFLSAPWISIYRADEKWKKTK